MLLMKTEFIGVYCIDAPEPCHLIEMRVSNYVGELDFSKFTQERGGDGSRWQVAYDERILDPTGTHDVMGRYPFRPKIDGGARIAFFFHYLDFNKPFITPAGRIKIPDADVFPKRLAFMQYEPPG